MNLIKGWIGLTSFPENMTSCACYVGSGLKYIFHLKAHSDNFWRIRVKITSWNVYVINNWENRCIISKEFHIWSNTFWKVINVNQKKKRAQNWALRNTSFNTSLFGWLTIKKNSLISSLKKISIRFKRLPEIPIDSSLYSKPFYARLYQKLLRYLKTLP